MRMTRESLEFTEKYNNQMSRYKLPEEIEAHYQVKKCLKEGSNSWTVVAQEKTTGILIIVKWAKGKLGKMLIREYKMLDGLIKKNIQEIPRPYCFLEKGEDVYLLREHIEGETLFDMAERSEPLPEKKIREIGIELCRLMEQLQELPNPLIHRDIKPENIIVRPDGTLVLVDFGTARYYREDGRGDTFLMGSPGTAAPEQYGCQQTDLRTDVYGIGMTLWYLASGSYDADSLKNSSVSIRLQKIICKAAAFDPKARYPSAKKLEKALARPDIPKEHIIAAGGILLSVLVGMTVYLYMDKKAETQKPSAESSNAEDIASAGTYIPPTGQQASVSFEEPLIEQAVRKQLGLSQTDIITREMLQQIYSLRIVGTAVLDDSITVENRGVMLYYNADGSGWDGGTGNGGIRSLQDLSLMENLVELVLCGQQISDLTPLEGLPISRLYLADNQIQDVSSLETLPYLRDLSLVNNPAKNMDAIGKCTQLKTLNLGLMQMENLDFLENLQLETLNLMNIQAEGGFAPLASQKDLTELNIDHLNEETAAYVRQLENLQRIYCWGDYGDYKDLTPFAGMEKLQMLAITSGLESLEGIGELPSLERLFVSGSDVHDLSPLREAKALKHLGINGQTIYDLKVILEIPTLELLICDESQKKQLLDLNPEPSFEIRIE